MGLILKRILKKAEGTEKSIMSRKQNLSTFVLEREKKITDLKFL